MCIFANLILHDSIFMCVYAKAILTIMLNNPDEEHPMTRKQTLRMALIAALLGATLAPAAQAAPEKFTLTGKIHA